MVSSPPPSIHLTNSLVLLPSLTPNLSPSSVIDANYDPGEMFRCRFWLFYLALETKVIAYQT